MAYLLVFHLFGVIFWLGSFLVLSSMLATVPDEVGVAKERLIVAARRLFRLSANLGLVVALAFGISLLVAQPSLLGQAWLQVKLFLVIVLIALHWRLHRRLVKLEEDPASATSGEFRMMHGAVSALLLIILALAILRPGQPSPTPRLGNRAVPM